MDSKLAFARHARNELAHGLRQIDERTVNDIYALSLFIYDEDDDPRRPTMTMGYNTTRYWQEQRPNAVDAAEARWNYAFWPQNQLSIIGNIGSESAKLWMSVATEIGLDYSDAEEDADFDRCEALGARTTAQFVHVIVEIARQMHESGIIETTFRRSIPIIIHELEYYEEIASQTEAANPPGAAEDFVNWVRGL